LDDLELLRAAQRDPEVLVGGNEPVTIDEVQRAPALLSAIKRAVDRKRRPGQYLLTGSANLQLMRQVSESLAGRASSLTLWPMTRREQLGLGACGVWESLLATPPEGWLTLLEREDAPREDWRSLALRGGFPTPALHLPQSRQRSIWFDGYVRTYLERDLADLAAVASLPDFRRLMRAACHRIGGLVNQTEIARDIAVPQPTVHRHLNLLEVSCILVRLPAFAVNRTKRLIKSAKLYWADTGLALHLAEIDELGGAHLENVLLLDLLAWRDARLERAEVFHWRTAVGEEVDLIVEAGRRLLPIEVKASARPRLSDGRGIHAFRAEHGERALPGLLVHTGSTTAWIASDILAVPWWKLL